MSNPVPSSIEVTQSRKLALAFQNVFGTSKLRGPDQKTVMDHLRKVCMYDKPIFIADSSGAFNSLNAAHIDGARTVYLIIERQLEIARRDQVKPKPKTIKSP